MFKSLVKNIQSVKLCSVTLNGVLDYASEKKTTLAPVK